ncbi:MAG: cyclase family protein [Clostridia bacterium]|nr:cyclase family protein [Clostridia bacterium]
MEIFDISADVLGESAGGKYTFLKSFEKGDECNLSAFSSSSHGATHIVAPSHFSPDGITVDELDLSVFIGSCKVIKVPEGPITGEYVENNFPRGCQRLLIKSGKSACFFDHGALCAVNLGYRMIGVDSSCISAERNKTGVYRTFSNNGVGVLEGLELEDIPEGNYSLIALPIKTVGLEAAPARAILIKEENKRTRF